MLTAMILTKVTIRAVPHGHTNTWRAMNAILFQ